MSVDYSRDQDVLKLQKREMVRLIDDKARRMIRRPCICQGYVTADPLDPTPGVREHQRTQRHGAWRERNGL